MKQPEGWVPRGHTICNGIADRHFLMFDMSPWCLILSRVSVTCLSWVGRHSVILNYKLVFKKIDAHGLAWHVRRDFHVSIFLIPLKSHFPGDCLIFSRVLIIFLRDSQSAEGNSELELQGGIFDKAWGCGWQEKLGRYPPVSNMAIEHPKNKWRPNHGEINYRWWIFQSWSWWNIRVDLQPCWDSSDKQWGLNQLFHGDFWWRFHGDKPIALAQKLDGLPRRTHEMGSFTINKDIDT